MARTTIPEGRRAVRLPLRYACELACGGGGC